MAYVSNSGIQDPIVQVAKIIDVEEQALQSKWYRWRKDGAALAKYLMDSEVHTFAFSVAANSILSFVPLVVLLDMLSRSVFRSAMMVKVLADLVAYFLPSDPQFIVSTLDKVARHQGGMQFFSLFMILVSCTGIFLPLEVALNQAWGVTKSRSYISNQVVAFGLAILMVVLAFGSILATAWERQLLGTIFPDGAQNAWYEGIDAVWFTGSSGVACILFLFAVYWILPNRKVPAGPVLRASLCTGVLWMISRGIFVLVLPHLHLKDLYGAFFISVGLLFWSYVSGLILFGGAQFSVARLSRK